METPLLDTHLQEDFLCSMIRYRVKSVMLVRRVEIAMWLGGAVGYELLLSGGIRLVGSLWDLLEKSHFQQCLL